MTDFSKDKDAFTSTKKTSISSASSSGSCLTLNDDPDTSNTFRPGTVLTINAQGVGVIRFPVPSSELEIEILGPEGTPIYTSKRAKICSGNAILLHAELGEVVSTQYRFGPNREPVLRHLQGKSDPTAPAMTVKSRWCSRAMTFLEEKTGRAFTWSYVKRKNAEGKKINILILRQQAEQGQSNDSDGKIVAQLLRGDGSRTPGTTKCRAGNGGQLLLDQDAIPVLDEALIVATCLVMLKKEIDRRRLMQMVMLGAIVSGGS